MGDYDWKRQTGGWGGNKRLMAHEDGKIYRGVSTDMAPVIKHVREQNELHNSGVKTAKMMQGYVGSVPMVMLEEWCLKEGVTVDRWAQDAALKAKFMIYFNSPEFRALQANDYKADKYVRGHNNARGADIDS